MHNLNGNTYEFLMAGCAIFTIENTATGNRCTFKVVQPTFNMPHFVKVMTGTDNTDDYEFLGTIFDSKKFVHGKKSRIKRTAQSAQVFAWAWPLILTGTLPVQVEVYHEGMCGRCGKVLTTPESCKSGFGPTCRKLMDEGI
jgi:hypothetical protein